MRFVLVSDPTSPHTPQWWVIRVRQGDLTTIADIHKWVSTKLFIKDGQDPHIQIAREREELDAILRHPTMLGAGLLSTMLKMSERGDFYVNVNGGMCPVGKLTEHNAVEAKNWPGQLDPERRISIHTWGNHYYLTADFLHPITFLDKFNTEAEAMEYAKLFALPERITLRREARQFKDGD